ncbi:prepilin-type N-terminal cleavage/methylation domain-containing protein [Ottowia sp.]|uniref:prepilin-type N-terminal cleavage/methylation domain-containing protein n=1 Tax=Ottowia sp. TaxID=1898956 RepID=UPI0039E2840B
MNLAARRRGFTLVEVLIALVLLSLLMLVLTGALRGLGEVEARVDQRIAAADDHRAAVQLLGDVLGRVSARRIPRLQAGGPSEAPFFQAAPDALAWVGVMPARFGLGGRHYLRLAVEQGPGGAQLVLRYAPWTGAAAFAAWDQAEGRVLAAPVQALSLRYLEPVSGQWSPEWPPAGVDLNTLPPTLLPEAVEIQIEGSEPAWPPLIVAVTATRDSDPTAVSGAFGGGGS